MTRKIIVAVMLLAVFVPAACSNRSGGGRPSGVPNPPFEGEPPEEAYVFQGEPGVYGGTIVLSQPSDMRTFNVIRANEDSSALVLWYHVFRTLVDYRNGDDPPDYEPGVSTKWDISSDAKQWTFHLRKGVRWSDGQPFTADDVLFSYEVIRDRNIDTSLRDVFVEGTDESGAPLYPKLDKIDDHTVQFTLNRPNIGFLDAVFNLYLIPKHKWEQVYRAGNFREAMKISDDPSQVVGLGPFRIKEYVTGQRAVLERNPYFWKVDRNGQRLPYLDRIIIVIARDFNTIMAKFQAGEIDVMDRSRAEEYALVKRLEGPGVKVQDIGTSYDSYWIGFNRNTNKDPNTGRPFVEPWKVKLFREQKFRQALSYAIDREGLINTVFSGRGEPIYSFLTPADKAWYSDDIMKYPYDPNKARQLLAEIGLKDTNGDGVLEDAEGHAVEFNINTNTENSQRVGAANFISRNWADVGVKANVAPMAFNQIVTMLTSTFNYDALVFGWQSAVPTGPVNTQNILLSSGQLHASFPMQQKPSTDWEARIDELVYKIAEARDNASRKQMYAEIQRIWSEQLPEIGLVAQKEAIAYKDKFGNFKPCPLQPRVTWNSEEIYVKQQ